MHRRKPLTSWVDVLPRDGFTLPIFFDLVALAELKGTVYLGTHPPHTLSLSDRGVWC